MNTPTRVSFFLLHLAVLLGCSLIATASPISDNIQVGDTVTGSFRYDLSESPPDVNFLPFLGEYHFTSENSFIEVSIDGHTFSSAVGTQRDPSTPGHLLVQVVDLPTQFDRIQIVGFGDEAAFVPFLSFFSRQNPDLAPLGSIALNFNFPPSYLTSDSLPTVIDPTAMVGTQLLPPVFGGVEAVSLQTPSEVHQRMGCHL
jgi:hypothetical protein